MARLTNDLNSSSHANLSSHTNAGGHPNFTVNQLRSDALSEDFSKQATDYHSLAAMSLGSLTFSSIRSLSTPLFSALFRSSTAVQSASWVTALGAEVGAFRASNQAMSEVGSSESWHDARAFTGTAMDFALLKGFSHFLHAESFTTRHSVSASAMVAGELAREATHLSEETHKTFSERFSHALVSSVALEAGSHLSRMATGGALQVFERNMQRGMELNHSGNPERRQNEARRHGYANLHSMKSNEQSTSRNFEIEGRNVTLVIEGQVSEARTAELQDQVSRLLQGELVFELQGIADEILKVQVRIYPFMPSRDTTLIVRADGEIRSLRITKDGREVARVPTIPVVEPAKPAAPVEAARPEVARPAERPVERVVARPVERPAERIEEPAWARAGFEHGELSVRASYALQEAGIRSWGQLLRCNEDQLPSTQAAQARGGRIGIGRKSLKEIKDYLAKNHLALGMTDAEIAAIPDLSTPRQVIDDSASGRIIVRVASRPVEEVTPRAVVGEISTNLISDPRCQGNIVTINGYFSDLIASHADWNIVRERARDLITQSARADALEAQKAKTQVLMHFLENAARFAGPADVLELISRIQRGVDVTNVRKYGGVLIGSAEKRRAQAVAAATSEVSGNLNAQAGEAAAPVEVAAFQASAAVATAVERVKAKPVERTADEEAGREGKGKGDEGRNEGDERQQRRQQEAAQQAVDELASADLASSLARARRGIDDVFSQQSALTGPSAAGARKAAQLRALKGIEDASFLPPQKLFLLEQFEHALKGKVDFEAVRRLRDRMNNRSTVLEELYKLSRRPTWKHTYDCANRVFHKILLLETDAYKTAIARFQEILENRKNPESPAGLGKNQMLEVLRRLEKADFTAEAEAVDRAKMELSVSEAVHGGLRLRDSDRVTDIFSMYHTICHEMVNRLKTHIVSDTYPAALAQMQARKSLFAAILDADLGFTQKSFLLDHFRWGLKNEASEASFDKARALLDRMLAHPEALQVLKELEDSNYWKSIRPVVNRRFHDILNIQDPVEFKRRIDAFVEILSSRVSDSKPKGLSIRDVLNATRRLVEEELPASPESKTRGDIRNLAAALPEELRPRINEIIDLIDTTYEIENVRRNPQLVVEAGEALPEKEGALRFAIARKKGRVDLNFKTTLEQCRGLSNTASHLMLEMQRKVIERKIESGELTRLRDRINSTEMLNGHMKNLEAREGLDAAEWTPVIDLLAQSYRRVILEVEKHSFFRTAGRFIDIAEAFTSRSPQDIIPRLQKLLAAEDIGLAVRELFEGLAIPAAPVAATAAVEAKPARLSADEATAFQALASQRSEKLQRVLREFIEATDHIFEGAETEEARELLDKTQAALRLLNEMIEADVERHDRIESRLADIFQIVLITRELVIFRENLDNFNFAYRIALDARTAPSEKAAAETARVEARVEVVHVELNETQRGLCERLTRPYNDNIAREAEGLLNAGEAWASVLSITFRLVERISSSETLPISANAAASKLFLVLRLRSKNTPDFVQGKLEALERELTPSSGPQGSDGAPPAPPSPPPPPAASPVGIASEAPAAREVPRAPISEESGERDAPPRVAETREVSTGVAPDLAIEQGKFREVIDQVNRALEDLAQPAKALKGLWKRLERTANQAAETIRCTEVRTLNRRIEALRQLKTILDVALDPQSRDVQKLVDQIDTLEREFRANPERFDAAHNTKALPAEFLERIQTALDDITNNPNSVEGNPHQKSLIRTRTKAILQWLESEQAPQNPAELLELLQRILALRTLDRHDYNASVIISYLDALERGLKSGSEEKVSALRTRLDTCYKAARAPEPLEPAHIPDELSKNEIKRRLFGVNNLHGYPLHIKNFYGRFQGPSQQGLVYLLTFGGPRSEALCRNVFAQKDNRLHEPGFASKTLRFFELVSSIAQRLAPTDKSLVAEIETFSSMSEILASDLLVRLERRAAARTAAVVVERAAPREAPVAPAPRPEGDAARVIDRSAPAPQRTQEQIRIEAVDREVLRLITLIGPAREAYDQLSFKARQGLAALLPDCVAVERREVIKRLLADSQVQRHLEGNYLNRLFECIANCYEAKIRGMYKSFLPGQLIWSAIGGKSTQLKQLNSCLNELETALRYSRRPSYKVIYLNEEMDIRWSTLTRAQKEYFKQKVDRHATFSEDLSKASPDFRFIRSEGSSYIVEAKRIHGTEFSPLDSPLTQLLKQVYRYAILRDTRPELRITHAEFVIQADTLEEDFVVLFQEVCENAKLPFVLTKRMNDGRLEVVVASPELNLEDFDFDNGAEFISARNGGGKPPTVEPMPAEAGPAEAAANIVTAPAAIEPAIPDTTSAAVRKAPSPEAIRWINEILPSSAGLRVGMNRRDTISAGRDCFEGVNKREFFTSLSQAARARTDLTPAQRAELEPLLERMQRTLGDKRFTITFINDILDVAAILTEKRTSDHGAVGSGVSGPSDSDLALQTLTATPTLITKALDQLTENLAVIEGDLPHFGLKDLADESPDLPFAKDIVGPWITLRELYDAIRANHSLRDKLGFPTLLKIVTYLNRYDALYARLQNAAQSTASESPSE